MAEIACDGLGKRYGNVRALVDVSCEVSPASVMLVLGPSGAGKTTLLRVVAGLERPDEGTVTIGGKVVTDPEILTPPHRRGLAFVFHRPTLWPHMNAVDNVALALVGRGLSRHERRSRAEAALGRLGMNSRRRAYPAELSGGEMQRVSLARALVIEPRILLLDEPFAGLDPDLRKDLTAQLAALKSDSGVTMLWVTHRHEEALALADRILVLRDGAVIENRPSVPREP